MVRYYARRGKVASLSYTYPLFVRRELYAETCDLAAGHPSVAAVSEAAAWDISNPRVARSMSLVSYGRKWKGCVSDGRKVTGDGMGCG